MISSVASVSTGPSKRTDGSKPSAGGGLRDDLEHLRAQPGLVVGAGLEAEDRRPDRADRVVDVGDRPVQPLLRLRRRAPGRGLERQADGEQALDDGVVQIARDPLPLGDEVELLDLPPGARERERRRGLHPERLQQVDLVRLERLPSACHQDADDGEGLAGRVQRHEQARAHPGVGQLARDASVGAQVGARPRCAPDAPSS